MHFLCSNLKPFTSFSYIIALARFSSTMLQRSGGSGQYFIILFPILKGEIFGQPTLNIMLAVVVLFALDILCQVRTLLSLECRDYFPLLFLNHEWCWILSKYLYEFIKIIIELFILVNMVNCIDWFLNVEQFFHF